MFSGNGIGYGGTFTPKQSSGFNPTSTTFNATGNTGNFGGIFGQPSPLSGQHGSGNSTMGKPVEFNFSALAFAKETVPKSSEEPETMLISPGTSTRNEATVVPAPTAEALPSAADLKWQELVLSAVGPLRNVDSVNAAATSTSDLPPPPENKLQRVKDTWLGGEHGAPHILYSGTVVFLPLSTGGKAMVPHGTRGGNQAFSRDGDEFVGSFIHSKRWGLGGFRYNSFDGSFFVGSFVDGLRHGKGTWVEGSTGEVFEGEWWEGKVIGDDSAASALRHRLRSYQHRRATQMAENDAATKRKEKEQLVQGKIARAEALLQHYIEAANGTTPANATTTRTHLKFKLNPDEVLDLSGGCRVRRLPSLEADHIATIEWGKHKDDPFLVSERRLVDNAVWLKLAPEMYNSLMSSSDFCTHDPISEGWVILVCPIDHKPLYIECPQPSPTTTRTHMKFKLTTAVPSGGCRVRRLPSLEADHIATIEWGKHKDDTILVSERRLVDNTEWLKLAPEMYNSLMGNSDFCTHDPISEGWVILVSPKEHHKPLYIECPQPSQAFGTPGPTSQAGFGFGTSQPQARATKEKIRNRRKVITRKKGGI